MFPISYMSVKVKAHISIIIMPLILRNNVNGFSRTKFERGKQLRDKRFYLYLRIIILIEII